MEVGEAVPLAVGDPVLTLLPVFPKAVPVGGTVGAPVGGELPDTPFVRVGAAGDCVMAVVLEGEEVAESVMLEVREVLGEALEEKGGVWVRE